MYERGRAAPTWHFVRPNGLEGGKFTLLHDVSRPIRELQESFMGVSQDRRAFAQGVIGASPTAREGQLCSQRQHPECMLDELTDIHEQKDKAKHASLTLSAISHFESKPKVSAKSTNGTDRRVCSCCHHSRADVWYTHNGP